MPLGHRVYSVVWSADFEEWAPKQAKRSLWDHLLHCSRCPLSCFFFPDNLSGNLQWIESFRAFKAIERFQSTPSWNSIMYLYMIYSYSFIHSFILLNHLLQEVVQMKWGLGTDLIYSGQEETKMRCAMLQWVRYWHITLLARSLSLHPKGQRTPRSSSKLIWKEGRFLQSQFSQYVFFFFCAYIQWLCSKGGCKIFWWLSNQPERYCLTFCRTTGQTRRCLQTDRRGNHHCALGLQIISNLIYIRISIYLLEVWHSP